jgi:signal transduction histidine kinase
MEALRVLAVQNPITCEIAMATSLTNTKRYLTDYGLSAEVRGRDWLSVTVKNSRLGMGRRQTVMMDAASNAIPGTLFVVPLYDPALAEATAKLANPTNRAPAQLALVRWVHLTGMIVAPVDFQMLARTVWDGAPADLGLELFSSTNQTAETWLNVTAGSPRAADPNFKPYLSQRRHWPMYGLGFSIFYYTTPLFEAQSPRRLARVATGAGLVLTLLAAVLVGVAVHSRSRQQRMTLQIREARDALATAQRERNKISRDLHDGTIQSLYAIQLGLGQTAEKLRSAPANADGEIQAVRRDLDGVIAEIRQFITVESGGEKAVDFEAVLQTLVQRARAGATAQIEVRCDPVASARLSGGHAVQLANCAREALSNSLRHAQPRNVRVQLAREGGSVILSVEDDGVGFDPERVSRTGVGLTSLAERTEEMGGVLEIRSMAGKGTWVSVKIPAAGAESEADAEAEGGE